MCERYSGIWGMDPISADPAHWVVVARDSQKRTLCTFVYVCARIRVCMDMCVLSCVKCVRCEFFKSSERQLRECEREWERERDGKYVCPVHTDLFVWEWINIYVGWKGGWICKTVGTKANNSGAAVQKDGTFPWLLRSPNRLRLEEEDGCLLFLSNLESISEPKGGISSLGGKSRWLNLKLLTLHFILGLILFQQSSPAILWNMFK